MLYKYQQKDLMRKKDENKKIWPARQTHPASRVENFLQVENINLTRQKLRVMRVNAAGLTYFAISTRFVTNDISSEYKLGREAKKLQK